MSIAPTNRELDLLTPTGDGRYNLNLGNRAVTLRRADLITIADAARETGSTQIRLAINDVHITISVDRITAMLRTDVSQIGGAA